MKSTAVIHHNIDILTNPKKFIKFNLELHKPYVIITGEGRYITTYTDHDCDCQYCEQDYEEVKEFLYTEEEYEKRIVELKDNNEEYEDGNYSYYAKIIEQEEPDGMFKDL